MTDTQKQTIGSICMVVAIIAVLGSSSCTRASGETESVTIAAPALEQNALIYVAEDQHFFERSGLTVNITDYQTGRETLGALMQGTADIAQTAELPFVDAALKKNPVSALAVNDRMLNAFVVGRKDHGIQAISDLKGKKIGITPNTVVEFFFSRFLTLHGMSLGDVTIVNMPPAQLASAIDSGELDAVAIWQPYVYQILKKEPASFLTWSVNSNQPAFGILVGRKDWLAQHGEASKRVLQCILDAQDFVVQHPDEARAIVGKRLGLDDAYLASVWTQHQFSVTLDYSLIVAMNEEARWMIAGNLTAEKQVPDFMDYIDARSLKAIKPDAVTVRR